MIIVYSQHSNFSEKKSMWKYELIPYRHSNIIKNLRFTSSMLQGMVELKTALGIQKFYYLKKETHLVLKNEEKSLNSIAWNIGVCFKD